MLNLENPSERARYWDRDNEGRTCFYDSQSWLGNEHHRRLVLESPMAEIAGRVMGVEAVNFFFDACRAQLESFCLISGAE